MALDIHRADNNEYIFGLDDERYNGLLVIFEQFKNSTGIFIDQYGNTDLDLKNIRFLIKLIDNHVEKTDLNKDKKETSIILEFKGLLNMFLKNNIPVKLRGD
ncbi:MAG: hypothetical protein FWG66_04150 [Spirochaetes bacterium]|nr:hypothetical protein [Spirochaetota bacterium]